MTNSKWVTSSFRQGVKILYDETCLEGHLNVLWPINGALAFASASAYLLILPLSPSWSLNSVPYLLGPYQLDPSLLQRPVRNRRPPVHCKRGGVANTSGLYTSKDKRAKVDRDLKVPGGAVDWEGRDAVCDRIIGNMNHSDCLITWPLKSVKCWLENTAKTPSPSTALSTRTVKSSPSDTTFSFAP